MTRLARQAGELLKLMRHRAEQLGGTLAIRSEPDRGSTVELRVPFEGGSAPQP